MSRSPAEQVVEAGPAYSPPALRALLPRVADPALREVVLAEERRLRVVRLDPDGDPRTAAAPASATHRLSPADLTGPGDRSTPAPLADRLVG